MRAGMCPGPHIPPLRLAGLPVSACPPTGSSLRGWGCCEGVFVSAFARVSKRFRLPAGSRATFLLRGQEKSSQKRRPPLGASCRPSMGGKSVSRGRAFRAGSCPREKASPSMASPAARPSRPRLTAAEGPQRQARIVRARSDSNDKSRAPRRARRFCSGFFEMCAPGARWSTRGPYGAAGGWRKVRRMAGTDAGQFFAGTGCAVEKPRSPPADPQGRRPEGRAIGVPLSLVTFSRARERK